MGARGQEQGALSFGRPNYKIMAVGVLLLTVPAPALIWELYANRTDAAASAKWPSVEGEITESEVHKRKSGAGTTQDGIRRSGSPTYTPHIRYRYVVGGQAHEGHRVVFGYVKGKGRSKGTVSRYPVGRKVRVFYDPARPNVSTLTRGAVEEMNNWGMIVAVVFVGLGFIVAAFVKIAH